ncbi:M48 family metalloprotease [Winogradskyella sp. 3972H.M.0a.05]|uniref:M48 family metallopeptidase n=1 Tax=Winogradskyella sp. 3972H.M.0a.05 TaxID=2950277 RepID=UPI0033918D05
MTTNYYPPNPTNLPKQLTALTSSYRTKAFLAILSIILFFVLYSALVLGLAYLAYYAFTYEMGDINKLTILMKVGAIAGSVMLFVFTLKFIFKLKNHKRTNRVKLNKTDYPELWDFVMKICKDTGAPKPAAIYVDPDVNAYVSYTNMWLSLFLPVKKELTIGLGLVSCLNLSEFKAVISHEFGHFAQSSMKVGSYIISANTIIHDMIFSRDKWDDLLDQWRQSDLRLSFAAWIITPIIWIIRQILNLFYQFLNIMYSSLSREMEFNADKVAISTTGSEAIVSALWKLDDGFYKWNETINHAYLAAQKKRHVQNLYVHNNLAIDRDKAKQNQILEALPQDSRGGKHYFSTSEHSKVGMYASHPPNNMREDSAKVPFIDCESDSRSPWILFRNSETLQQKMTSLVYKEYLNKTQDINCTLEEFEAFIISENQSKSLLEDYENTFENRFLNIPDIDSNELNLETVDTSKIVLDNLKAELKSLMDPIRDLETLMDKAGAIAQGTTKENVLSFKDRSFKKKNIQEGYELILNERESLLVNSFKEWDKSFCTFHLALAKKHNQLDTLSNLYSQHVKLSDFFRDAVNIKGTIITELNNLQNSEPTQTTIHKFGYRVNELITSLNEKLEALESDKFVPLPNIESPKELREALTEDGSFKEEKGNIFDNGGFNRLFTALENSIVHCQRIDQKSVGAILEAHNSLHQYLE